MVTPHDVQAVTFEKAMRGYRTEEVDHFLDKIAEQLEQDAQKIADLQKKCDETQENLYLMAHKVEEYRADENNLKSALLNAQRMGESVIREAKQKAETIEREANIRADNVVRGAADKAAEEKIELERIKAEVAQFKSSVLSLYKRHIESLSTLPGSEPEPAEPEEEPAPAEEPVAKEMPAVPQEEAEENEPAEAQQFWAQDENTLKAGAVEKQPDPFGSTTFSD